jgi:hypothetical protein
LIIQTILLFRLERQHIQPEQPRSVWSRPGRRGARQALAARPVAPRGWRAVADLMRCRRHQSQQREDRRVHHNTQGNASQDHHLDLASALDPAWDGPLSRLRSCCGPSQGVGSPRPANLWTSHPRLA